MSGRKTLTIRLAPETRAQIVKAQAILPYFPTITSVVERGIVLALEELTAMAAVLKEKDPTK